MRAIILSAAAAAMLLVAPEGASAQIGAARQIIGSPVAARTVRARFVWGGTGNRIIYVNQADEVFFHRVRGNTVQMHIRMRGHTVGHAGDPTEYVIPWGNTHILVVTQRGSVYRHTIRAESIGPPEQIHGAPVGTQGQDPVFMFRVGNRLINATRQGEIWAHTIGRTVSAPVRIGTVAIAASRTVRHAFNLGRTVYIIFSDGAVVAHDIFGRARMVASSARGDALVRPRRFGRARIIRSSTLELGRPATSFVWVMGNRLYAVNEAGTLWAHDITRLRRAASGGEHH